MSSEVRSWKAEVGKNTGHTRDGANWKSFISDSRIPTSEFNIFRLPIFIILLFIFAPWIIGAGDTAKVDSGTLTASLDQASAPVGGLVWLTLDYRLPKGGRLPEKPEVKGLDGLSILKQIINPRQIRIQLLLDHLGPWQSEPISLSYLDSKGQTQLLTAHPVSIQAVSNLGEKAEKAQLRPIRDIVPVKSIWQSYLLWLAAFAALVLIGLGLFWWYKRRQTPAALTEYMEPPGVRARRELRGLETQRYFENGMVKKHYFVFSEILRRYLESIRSFPAVEYTTEEIAQHIRTEQDRQLLPLLQRADLVKFADDVPTTARKEEDIQAALAYIRETGPPLASVSANGRRPEVQP